MDLGTIIGVGGGFVLLVVSILLGGDIMLFVDIPSVIVVMGGVLTVLLTNFPMARVFGVSKAGMKAIIYSAEDPTEIIKKMVNYAERARKEGMLALEEESENEPDKFLAKGLRLAVDGTDPQLLSTILETDIAAMETRHRDARGVFDVMGSMAPAFGMIGTLMGLVLMLANMSDPSAIGGGMAVALLTTFYGSVIANVIAIPIAGKLKIRSESEVAIREMIVQGIMSIQSGDSPRIVQEKLKSYLTPAQQLELKA